MPSCDRADATFPLGAAAPAERGLAPSGPQKHVMLSQ
jgi:hypothetical protein